MSQSGTIPLQVHVLTEVPLPPSDNHLFLNIPRKGRVKGPGYRAYELEFEAWRLDRLIELRYLKKALNGAKRLQIDFLFNFEYGQLFCKDGSIKRLDVQNRFKAICDLLANAIGMDDRHFFKVSAQKLTAKKQSVEIRIKVLDSE